MRLTSLPAQWMYLLDVIDAFETDDLKSAACCLAQAIHTSVLRLSVGCGTRTVSKMVVLFALAH